MLVYIDGRLVPKEQATISVLDHGFLYGDGVFEGIRCYDGTIFRLDAHLERLYESARTLSLVVPLDYDELKRATVETVAANGLRDCYIRLVVSRGKGDLGIDPDNCKKATIVIIIGKITLYPPRSMRRGSSWSPPARAACPCSVSTRGSSR
jgi:branched-chain amino acid aminotransferase